MFKKALIICNGAAETKKFLAREAKNSFVLCVDGGADAALRAGVTPRAVIGDMDSVSFAARKKFKKTRWIKIDDQNNTDFDKAVNFIKTLGVKEARIVCAAGGRLDFTLSNLLAAFKYLPSINIVFKSAEWEVYPLVTPAKFKCRRGARVSLIPAGKCAEVSLSGLKYPLEKTDLDISDTLTLSNVSEGKTFEVKFKKGSMLVYIEV